MLFPTLDFALFFLIVFTVSWSLVGALSLRKAFLLAASYVFYGYWDWRFLALLAGSSAFNYLAGLALARARGPALRRAIVALAVAGNLTVLGFFKYYNFFLEELAPLLASAGFERDLPVLEIILPVGISFFTFQGISYVVDVYRREIEPVRSPLDLFLYISFFSQLVAGPIVRASHFLPQLAARAQLTARDLALGLTLIVIGLFKKMVLANHLASEVADKAFFDPTAYGGIDLLVGIYAYAAQIYCDFSGYSDIGIGTALLLGLRFHANFNQPYRARSLREFWQRWHISLSQWLRDYLYKPLGGSRGGAFGTYRNLMVTMFLGGLWHGAAWTFVIWGFIHGSALCIERVVGRWRSRVPAQAQKEGPSHVAAQAVAVTARDAPKTPSSIGLTANPVLGILLTFHIVCFAWVFFRAPDLAIALAYLQGLGSAGDGIELATPFALSLIVFTLAFQFVPPRMIDLFAGAFARLGPVSGALAIGVSLGAALLIIESVGPEGVAPFIYFQF
ncbi:MAG: MBOAT family protein [Pseudomonadota bacterium]